MTRDYFELLNEPRRPWLDAEELKKKFLALSAAVHPDRVHGSNEDERQAAQARYTELNSAYNRLREPKERLQHFLELELGAKPAQVAEIPGGLMEVFFEVGKLCREVDSFLAERESKNSPLLRVEMFERGQEWTQSLQALQAKLNGRRTELENDLKRLDAEWDARGNDAMRRTRILTELEELFRLFSYFSRWNAQLAERVGRLAV